MNTVLRYLINLLIALALIGVSAAVLAAGFASVTAERWERYALDEQVAGGQWVWIEDKPYHYETWGPDEGPTVVLVHGGYVEGARTWGNNAWDISRSGVRVVAVDLAGLGLSSRDVDQDLTLTGQAQLVSMVLNELRIGGATVVGHDYGAAVALEMAQVQPQFVGSLVLIAPQIDAAAWPRWREWARVPYLQQGLAWGMDCGGPLWERTVQQAFADPLVAQKYIADIGPMTRIDGSADALVAIAATRESGLRSEWQELDVPRLVIVGDTDRWFDAAGAERTFPGAQVEVIEGVGHMPHVEASAQVNRLLVQFAQDAVR